MTGQTNRKAVVKRLLAFLDDRALKARETLPQRRQIRAGAARTRGASDALDRGDEEDQGAMLPRLAVEFSGVAGKGYRTHIRHLAADGHQRCWGARR